MPRTPVSSINRPEAAKLTPLERAVAAQHAGAASVHDIFREFLDAELLLASSVDPATGTDPRFATTTTGGVESLLLWTHEGFLRDVPRPHWTVRIRGRDVTTLLPPLDRLVVDVNTSFMAALGPDQLASLPST